MLVIWPFAIVEDAVEIRALLRVGIEPRVEVFGFDRHDAAIMAPRSDFRRRLVGDGSALPQILAWPFPMRHQTGHQHVLARFGPELQHDAFFFLARSQFAPFGTMAADVLVEGIGHH